MPRQPRIDVPGLPQHLVVRGNNRAPCFVDDRDRWIFLRYLGEALLTRDCELHAYVLMGNHVHLLATGLLEGSLSLCMQDTGRRFVRYFNAVHGRSGGLFEGRFRSSIVDSDRYLLACMRYIEMNPVRAGLARTPGEYPWSSYCANASTRVEFPLTAHPAFEELGTDPAGRAQAYRKLFETPLADAQMKAIRESLAMNRALGADAFIAQLRQRLDRPVAVVAPGRPRKKGTGEKVT
jgi:putative transposase